MTKGCRSLGQQAQPQMIGVASFSQQRKSRRSGALVAVVLAVAGCTLLSLTSLLRRSEADPLLPAQATEPATAFAGPSSNAVQEAARSRSDSRVAMKVRSRRWTAGMPNAQLITAMKQPSPPSLNNMKDQYFILWVRSPKVKMWYALNIISGSEAGKTLKNVAQNNIAKAVGVDKLAGFQIVKAIGMNIYQQKDEIKKQSIKMHPGLKYAKDIQFGFKEILNNTEFNDKPANFLSPVNITIVPPEAELRNILDEAGEAAGNLSKSFSNAGDQIKGFFSSGNAAAR